MALQIDIISDVMCPWCAIGYSALKQAAQSFPEAGIQIRWHPFELNPNMPVEGQDLREHLAEKYGSTEEESEQNRIHMTKLGNELGFEFNFSDTQRIVNTFNAHQLLTWAGELQESPGYADDLQTQLKMALFTAYFRDGVDVSNTDELIRIATDVGLSAQEAQQLLEQQTYAGAVRAEQQQFQQMGINSVPGVILANKYLVSGGQPVEVFKRAIQQVLDEQAA